MKKTVLVTGGAGFLGSHLCERLLAKGCHVICMDNFYTGSWENVRPLTANPDFELLRTVLVNLLDNARKASQPGQTVTMKGTTGFLQVEDEGCGIAPEDKARITEAFYMVDKARSREAGGCGLGLALSSAILRALDLKLEIESEPGKGSCFRIMSLPAAEPYSGKGPKEEAE